MSQGKRADGTIYQDIFWRDSMGVRRTRRLGPSEAVANATLAQKIRERDLEKAGLGGIIGQEALWSDVLPQYLAELALRATPDYVDRTGRDIARVLKECRISRLGEIKSKRIKTWRKKRAAACAPKTANEDVNKIRTFLSWCVEDEILAVNPLAELRSLPNVTTRIPGAMNEAEIARVLVAGRRLDEQAAKFSRAEKTIKGGTKGRKWSANERPTPADRTLTLRFFLAVGCRYGAARQLLWSDYSAEAALLTFRAEIVKTKVSRQFPVGDELLGILEEVRLAAYRATGRMPSPKDPILISPRGCALDKNGANFRRWFYRALDAASVPRFREFGERLHTHALRHTWATRMMRLGMPKHLVQYLGGWSSSDMLDKIYVHAAAEDARDLIAARPLPSAGIPTDKRPMVTSDPALDPTEEARKFLQG